MGKKESKPCESCPDEKRDKCWKSTQFCCRKYRTWMRRHVRRKTELWIVAVDEAYYPTVSVFTDEKNAKKHYGDAGGDVVYLAKVVRKKQGSRGALKGALERER